MQCVLLFSPQCFLFFQTQNVINLERCNLLSAEASNMEKSGSYQELVNSLHQCRKCLTHSHTMTHSDALGNMPFENTMGNAEIARNSVFYPFGYLSAIFVKF